MYDPDTGHFVHYRYDDNNPSGINNNQVHSIIDDNKGNLWIGTYGGGINCFNKKSKTFKHFIHSDFENSISNNSIGSIFQDEAGNLWIGTDAGLNFMNIKTNRFSVY